MNAIKRFARNSLVAIGLVAGCAAPAFAQVNLSFNVPGARIGVNLGGYPALQPIPGYPVYYAPGVNANYFFYDGLYWVFDGVNWYASNWYNGPWGLVDPYEVPLYVLRVPVRYYRHAPAYFHGWRGDAAPHWGEHWGRGWEDRHHGWDHWDRRSTPAAAPLPHYQRDYRGDRYPSYAQQQQLHQDRYRYQPREEVSRRHYEERRNQAQSQAQQQPQQRHEEHRGPQQAPGQQGHEHRQPQSQQQQQQQQPQAQRPTPSQERPAWYSGG